MPITFTRLAISTASTTNQSTAYTATAGTCASGDLLIAFVIASGNTTAGTMAGGSLTWTLLTSQTKNVGADICAIYWAYATTGISITPSYTPSAAATGCIICVNRVAGSTGDASGPNLQQTTATATGTTANPTITFASATLNSNGILLFASNGNNSSIQFTAPTGFTELDENAYSTPSNAIESAARTSGGTLTTYTWTNTSTTSWRTFGLEFVEAVATSFDPMGQMGFFGI